MIHPSSASWKYHQDEQCKQLHSSHLCQHYIISLPIALHNEDLQEQRKDIAWYHMILHDIAWYCMPILCPFLAAATHLAKGNLEQLASGGPSNQEPLTLFFLAQAPMNGELVFSGTISLPFKDLCTCGWKTKHTWWWVMIKDGWSKIDQWSMIEDRSMIHEKRRSMFC